MWQEKFVKELQIGVHSLLNLADKDIFICGVRTGRVARAYLQRGDVEQRLVR